MMDDPKAPAICIDHEALVLREYIDRDADDLAVEELEHWFFDRDRAQALQIFDRLVADHGSSYGHRIMAGVRQLAADNRDSELLLAMVAHAPEISCPRMV